MTETAGVGEFHNLVARVKSALEASKAPTPVRPEGVPAPMPVSQVTQVTEMVSSFARELEGAKGRFLGTLTMAEAASRIAALAFEVRARSAAVGAGVVLDAAPIAAALKKAGCALVHPGSAREDERAGVIERLAECDLSVAEAHCAIASTGTFAVLSDGGRPSSLTLLAPTSIIIVHVDRLVFDLAAALGALGTVAVGTHRVTLITGPSRTADIEKRLVLGVHGPNALYGAIIWPRNE